MTAEILTRYVHFLGIFVIFGLLTMEHVLLKERLAPERIRRLAMYDIAYGIAALITLGAGLALVFLVGKAAAYYTANPVFWAKVGLFVAIAALSIRPAAFLRRHRDTEQEVEVPRSIVLAVRWEMTLLVLMPLLGTMMARGVGINWFQAS